MKKMENSFAVTGFVGKDRSGRCIAEKSPHHSGSILQTKPCMDSHIFHVISKDYDKEEYGHSAWQHSRKGSHSSAGQI